MERDGMDGSDSRRKCQEERKPQRDAFDRACWSVPQQGHRHLTLIPFHEDRTRRPCPCLLRLPKYPFIASRRGRNDSPPV